MQKISTELLHCSVFSFSLFTQMVWQLTPTSYTVLDVLGETMPKAAMEASVTIEDAIRNQLSTLNIISSLDFMKALKNSNEDNSALKSFMSEETDRAGHKQMILADRNGRVLYSSGPVAGSSIADNSVSGNAVTDSSVADIKGDPFFESALSGGKPSQSPCSIRMGRASLWSMRSR